MIELEAQYECGQCGGIIEHWIEEDMGEHHLLCTKCGWYFGECRDWDDDFAPSVDALGHQICHAEILPGLGATHVAYDNGGLCFGAVGRDFDIARFLGESLEGVDEAKSYVTEYDPVTGQVRVIWGGGRPWEWPERVAGVRSYESITVSKPAGGARHENPCATGRMFVAWEGPTRPER